MHTVCISIHTSSYHKRSHPPGMHSLVGAILIKWPPLTYYVNYIISPTTVKNEADTYPSAPLSENWAWYIR